MNEAQAVVETTYKYIWKTKATLGQLTGRQRLWDLLTGDTLMSAYTNLHAAESARVLLLSKDQLAAILPSIRQRAAAFLPKGDPNRDALDTVPDPTVPAHQTMTTPVQAQAHGQASKPDAGASAGKQAGGKKAGGKKAGGKNPGSNQNAGQGHNPPPDGTAASAPPSGTNVLTPMLGADQQVAAQVMNAACRAEDLQQLRVRHFRGVLYGTSFVLFVVVAVLWILGSVRSTYFPLCWPVPGSKPSTLICPTGGHAASIGSVPIILGMGAIGALLAVALNLAGLKPAGARFSLTVAQGLLKIPFGAITAVLGIILLHTLTNAPGLLATQAGLLTAAVVFGYSQQLFTRLVDNQASVLLNAVAPTTPAAQPTN